MSRAELVNYHAGLADKYAASERVAKEKQNEMDARYYAAKKRFHTECAAIAADGQETTK